MDPEADAREIYQRLGKLLTPKQVELVVQALYQISNHGYGSIELHYREGRLVGINVTKQIKVAN